MLHHMSSNSANIIHELYNVGTFVFCFFLTDVINFCLGYPENHSADFWGEKKQNIFVKQKICAAGFQFDIKNISCAGLDFLFFFPPVFVFIPKLVNYERSTEKKKKIHEKCLILRDTVAFII